MIPHVFVNFLLIESGVQGLLLGQVNTFTNVTAWRQLHGQISENKKNVTGLENDGINCQTGPNYESSLPNHQCNMGKGCINCVNFTDM